MKTMTPIGKDGLVDVLILGAGAAGLMCAMESARRGRRTVVLERNSRPGRKILISGGGRCNFTNIDARPENFLSGNPHFAKSAAGALYAARFHSVGGAPRHPLSREETGAIVLRWIGGGDRGSAGARMRAGRGAGGYFVRGGQDRRSECFTVETSAGVFTAQSLVIACGGLSIPKIGATGFGYDVARQFGLGVTQPRPALVPLLFDARGPRTVRRVGRRLDGGHRDCRTARRFARSCCSRIRAERAGDFAGVVLLERRPRDGDRFAARSLTSPAALREARGQGHAAEARTWLAQRLPKSLARAIMGRRSRSRC